MAILYSISFAIIYTSSSSQNEVFAFSPSPITCGTSWSFFPKVDFHHDNRRHNVGGTQICMSTTDNSSSSSSSGNKKKTPNKKQQGKRRRFLQQAHPLPSSTTSSTSSLTGGANNNISDDGSNSNNKKQAQQQQRPTRRGPPLQTSKSIEELESILEKRWGTSTTTSVVNKGSATRDDDADFILSFDTTSPDEDDYNTSSSKRTRMKKFENNNKSASNNSNSLKGAAVFRNVNNRVRDPWAVEEGIYSNYSNEDDDDDGVVEGTTSSATPKKKNRKRDQQTQTNYDPKNEIMLDRVRANQERLQKQRNNNNKTKKKKNDSVVDVVPLVDIMSRDYYDEDDEGYESSSAHNKKNINQGSRTRSGSSLISPKPVGGSGSGSGSSSSSLSSGIFTSRSNENDPQTTTKRRKDRSRALQQNEKEEEELLNREKKQQRQKERERKSKSKPTLLDDEGNEMYLTLDQADKIVQRILLTTKKDDDTDTTSSSSDDDDDDINDENNKNIIQQQQTTTTEITSTSWEDIGITDSTLLTNLHTMICPTPLSVQDQSCPSIVSGNDVLISTHTGSGKTLAFLVPIAQRLLMIASSASAQGNNSNEKNTPPGGASDSGGTYPKAIIVAPGRELSSQIVSVAQSLFVNTGLTVSLAIGGTPYSRNVDTLRKKKPTVVVGTPGRIAELIIGRPGDKGGKLKLSGLVTVVLDEFDALLQYDSHKEPTVAIMNAMKRQHGSTLQRILCSATATDMIGQKTMQEEGAKKNGDKSWTTNIEDYLRQGYAHASVNDSDLLVTSGVHHTSATNTINKKGIIGTTARVSRTTIHGTLHVPHQRLALEAVRKILNTEPIPQQALIFVDSPRRVDIVIEKVRSILSLCCL